MFISTMAIESLDAEDYYLRNGCIVLDATPPISLPLSFWTEQDIADYIEKVIHGKERLVN